MQPRDLQDLCVYFVGMIGRLREIHLYACPERTVILERLSED